MIRDTLLKERKKSSKQEEQGWQNNVKGSYFSPGGNVELIAREAYIEITINVPLLHLCPIVPRQTPALQSCVLPPLQKPVPNPGPGPSNQHEQMALQMQLTQLTTFLPGEDTPAMLCSS